MLCKNYTKRKYSSKNYKKENKQEKIRIFYFLPITLKIHRKREVKFIQMDSQENKMTTQGHQG